MAFLTLVPVLVALFSLVPAVVLPSEAFASYLDMAFSFRNYPLYSAL